VGGATIDQFGGAIDQVLVAIDQVDQSSEVTRK